MKRILLFAMAVILVAACGPRCVDCGPGDVEMTETVSAEKVEAVSDDAVVVGVAGDGAEDGLLKGRLEWSRMLSVLIALLLFALFLCIAFVLLRAAELHLSFSGRRGRRRRN